MDLKKILAPTFALLSKASARKKVYGQKAKQNGREDVSHLLRAISESEAVQTRRLLNNLRGQIDTSDQYLSTIFEQEIKEIIDDYSVSLAVAEQEGNKALAQVLGQLRAAERRVLSFYSQETKDCKTKTPSSYFVCQFCGYINEESLPESCPICRAEKSGFREVR